MLPRANGAMLPSPNGAMLPRRCRLRKHVFALRKSGKAGTDTDFKQPKSVSIPVFPLPALHRVSVHQHLRRLNHTSCLSLAKRQQLPGLVEHGHLAEHKRLRNGDPPPQKDILHLLGRELNLWQMFDSS